MLSERNIHTHTKKMFLFETPRIGKPTDMDGVSDCYVEDQIGMAAAEYKSVGSDKNFPGQPQ